jgi:hypothetical protein
MIADIIRGIHMGMFVVVMAGPFVLPARYLPAYLLFVWLIFMDWNDTDGMCILTKLEHYFRTGEWVDRSPVEGGPEFFRPLLSTFGMELTRVEADRLNNFVFLLFWGVGLVRYIAWCRRR